jgi:2-polyprenyl-3-methyl-5-hydroxy-6-metoxy-1,4-benzoquinol methylase
MNKASDKIDVSSAMKTTLEPDSVAITTTDFWDDQWDERASRSSLGGFLHRCDFGAKGFFARLMKQVAPEGFKNARVVELGGASSRYLVDFAQNQQAHVTAVDYSEVGIRQTQALFAKEGVNGDVILADMFAWKDEDIETTFDVVTHWGLLEHFSDPFPTLDISARLVRSGGLVIFTMPNMAAFGTRFWKRYSPANYGAHIYHSDEAVKKACKAAGLLLVRTFHAGVPLVRMAPAERYPVGAFFINIAHTALLTIGAILPGFYLRGTSYLSNTRGFVARKP